MDSNSPSSAASPRGLSFYLAVILTLALISSGVSRLIFGPADPSGPALETNLKLIFFEDFSLMESLLSNPNTVLLDARDPRLYAIGRLPGAVSFPAEDAPSRGQTFLRSLSAGAKIVAYCSERFCPLAEELATSLLKQGASEILVFAPGYDAWSESGRPVERP
ncbi:MAG: rhodanese-like domain-containing protein [Deltaproteobacteria bacterium]|jgi:rhodanese-related sulfurtransferase|nr:rhodanese-like domain-containing protein [Deltaproteobacteria bacterium]